MCQILKRSLQALLFSIFIVACSQDSNTKRLLNDYPLEQINSAQQDQELSQYIITNNKGKKKLSPGIYCARILYNYGNADVGNFIMKDRTTYGARADTIEVEIVSDDTLNYIYAFIVNDRKDIFRLPKDSLRESVGDESITYLRSNYHYLEPADREGSQFSGTYRVKLNGQIFYRYFIDIFAKGGRCANDLSRNVPPIEEVLAVNLKHEALQANATALKEQAVLDATRQIHANSSSSRYSSGFSEYDFNQLSPEDKAVIEEREQRQEDNYRDFTFNLEDRISAAKSRISRLKSPSYFIDKSEDGQAAGEAGMWDRFKLFIKGIFSTKSESRHISLNINSLSDETNVSLKKGDDVTISATGSIVLGIFAGSGGPDGIIGWKNYCKKPGFNHGALMAKIGNNDWFLIGSRKSFVAQSDGVLHLGINVTDPEGDNGMFAVECNINP